MNQKEKGEQGKKKRKEKKKAKKNEKKKAKKNEKKKNEKGKQPNDVINLLPPKSTPNQHQKEDCGNTDDYIMYLYIICIINPQNSKVSLPCSIIFSPRHTFCPN